MANKKVEIEVKMKLRLATRYDLVDNANNYKYGTMYFLRSGVTGKFSPFPYYITIDTNFKEFNEYFKYNQVFVPVRHFDNCEVTLTPINNPQQSA